MIRTNHKKEIRTQATFTLSRKDKNQSSCSRLNPIKLQFDCRKRSLDKCGVMPEQNLSAMFGQKYRGGPELSAQSGAESCRIMTTRVRISLKEQNWRLKQRTDRQTDRQTG